MDLQHPSITKTLRTGYPYNEKKPTAMGNFKNNLCGKYTTDRGDKTMELINVIKDTADHNELIEKMHGVTSIRKSYLGSYHASMHDVCDFYEATKEFQIVFGKMKGEEYSHRASAIVGDVEIAIVLDDEEFKELRGLLDNE